MSRARLDIGTSGDVAFIKTASGRTMARARYRDWDGTTRFVQATGDTRAAADRALKAKLPERAQLQSTSTSLTPDCLFEDFVEYWLADLDLEARISKNTREFYDRSMRTLVLPAFRDLTLREIGVARCDRLWKQLAAQSYSRAKRAKVVLRLAFGLAVRHEVLPRNPADHVARLRRPEHSPDALTAVEVNAVRLAIAHWEVGLSAMVPKPDGQLGALVEVMLGTSSRIGEVLAIRRCDIDVTGPTPSVRLAGTIISQGGDATFRQDHPKTARSRRTIAIPTFATEAIRRCLGDIADTSPDALLFSTRTGTPLTSNNVRRQLRLVLGLAGIAGVTPHLFRRSAATAVHDGAGVDLAAQLLGHADPTITIQHYIRRSEMVDPATAALLDRAFAKEQ